MIYLCATPIGNLEDITLRVLRVLREADCIAAEDTRRAGVLLSHYGITTSVVSFHEHNEAARSEELLAAAQAGRTVAVISDAGLPGISDPGSRLVAAAAAAGVGLTVLPGANAALTALVGSGLSTEAFYFGGFLPRRSRQRKKALEDVVSLRATLIFYEAPHRLAAMLADLLEVFGPRPAVVARELTKLYEELRRGSLEELQAHYRAEKPRGELVVLVQGAPRDRRPLAEDDVRRAVLDQMEAGTTKKEAIKDAARRSGLSKNEVYQRVLDVQERSGTP